VIFLCAWIAASVSHAIIGAADEVRGELLRIAKTMPVPRSWMPRQATSC
jgi:hypothetical protein